MLEAQSLVEELEAEVDGKSPGFRLISQSLLLLLVGKLSRWYSAEIPHISGAVPAIARSIAHIEEHFCDSLSVESLADVSGLSERSFYRAFRCATGVSPSQYLTNVRLSHVAQLLAHSSMSITNIAFECGFQDGSHMAKLFKNRMGFTPRAFRSNRT